MASPKWGVSPAQGLKGRPRGHPSVLWEAARLHMAERSMRYCGGQDPFLEYSSQRHSEVRIVTENTQDAVLGYRGRGLGQASSRIAATRGREVPAEAVKEEMGAPSPPQV